MPKFAHLFHAFCRPCTVPRTILSRHHNGSSSRLCQQEYAGEWFLNIATHSDHRPPRYRHLALSSYHSPNHLCIWHHLPKFSHLFHAFCRPCTVPRTILSRHHIGSSSRLCQQEYAGEWFMNIATHSDHRSPRYRPLVLSSHHPPNHLCICYHLPKFAHLFHAFCCPCTVPRTIVLRHHTDSSSQLIQQEYTGGWFMNTATHSDHRSPRYRYLDQLFYHQPKCHHRYSHLNIPFYLCHVFFRRFVRPENNTVMIVLANARWKLVEWFRLRDM